MHTDYHRECFNVSENTSANRRFAGDSSREAASALVTAGHLPHPPTFYPALAGAVRLNTHVCPFEHTRLNTHVCLYSSVCALCCVSRSTLYHTLACYHRACSMFLFLW